MRIVFMGTPAFAVPSLAALIANGHEIACVYTQPPRPAGRGHRLTPSPVETFAREHGLEVRSPERLKSSEEKAAFAALDADIGVVVAYGLILPRSILDAPRLGCVNLHGSLLPRWRGAAPIQRAIMAGDAMSGVQVMQMEAGLDTGPVLMSETVPIDPATTAGTLSERLATVGADLLVRALPALDRGGITPQPQDEAGVTYAEKITAEEARIDWARPAAALSAHIRGLNPVPGAWCLGPRRDGADPARLKVWMAQTVEVSLEGEPGTVITAGVNGIDIATGEGLLRITRLQRPGKGAQDAKDFLNGADLVPGDRLG